MHLVCGSPNRDDQFAFRKCRNYLKTPFLSGETIEMLDNELLGDKYKALYEGYYDATVAQKREIAAIDSFSHIRKIVGPDEFNRVLDVGAGEGSLLSCMQSEGFGAHLYAVEISESGLDAIRSRRLSRLVEAQLFDGYHIPYPDKFFDLAISAHVLEHVEHERLFLAELKRVAKKVAIEVPLEDGFRIKSAVVGGERFGHINFYNPSTVLGLLKTSGLKPNAWMVNDTSVKYEQYLSGRNRGFVKHCVRNAALRVLPRIAPYYLTYVFTVVSDTEGY